ncbi:hypothetical protein QBC32DRAFT_352293 [Pseudoneurospora amorphoporcata]|uniref:Uncharacterized protein n=1 Tax=Pseudoneurospora amorphoporcata TaxID=241081 RepID=A0AAN6SC37_9PEZI|nr:hypothetical protein QBC32DRAFT_352293 [Pseudoneurospora amorphoporcata]
MSNWGNKVLPCSLHSQDSAAYLFLSTSLEKFNGIQEAEIRLDRQPIHATNMEGLVRLLHDNTPNIDIGNTVGLDRGILIGFFNVFLVNHRVKTLSRFPTHFTMPWRVPRMLNLRHYSVV